MAVAAEAPFDYLEAKLAGPAVRAGTVTKNSIVERLCQSSSRLVTVVAPAGYGKTTLLANWAASDPREFGWVSLDAGDDDPVVLMRYIAVALDRIEPIPPSAMNALSGMGAAEWASCAPLLRNAFASREQPVVLVLDDLHMIANTSCLDVISELFEYVPPGSQIAIASREAPALPLGRWRAQGHVDELGTSDLRFDDEEAGSLLTAAQVSLDGDQVGELTRRTEGWPAGIYLAALAFRAGAQSVPEATMITGDDRYMSEYFRDEILARLPDDERQFLSETSVLGSMSGELCDHVRATNGSSRQLAALERNNCFVIALDRRGEWFRYHHLFAQLLRSGLERDQPGALAGLNRRAMEWCADNGQKESAIRYGQAAGEAVAVATLLDTQIMELYVDGRRETADELLAWFSDVDLARFPALAVFKAWLAALTGRAEDAERSLAIADGATSEIPLSDGCATIEPWIGTLRAHMMCDGVEQAAIDAGSALEELPGDSIWRPVALLGRGVANVLRGEIADGKADLGAAVSIGLPLGNYEDVFLAHAQLALLGAREGDWAEARRQSEAAQAIVDEHGLSEYPTSANSHVATARVAAHEGRHDDAKLAVARAHRLRPMLDHTLPWSTVAVGLELTRIHLALAQPEPARTVLAETEQVLSIRPELGLYATDARQLRERVMAIEGPEGAWAMSLTKAELRLLPYLATHLTFPGIAKRLFISRNTVKSEAVSIYRKLGVASRNDAIERAVEVGLLDASIYPPEANLTQVG